MPVTAVKSKFTYGRGHQAVRLIMIMSLLSERSWTIEQLAEKLEISTKTIRRDLYCLEDLGAPIYNELEKDFDLGTGRQATSYRIKRDWMQRILRFGSL